MKVKAKANIKYGNGWFSSGEVFDIRDSELSDLLGLVEPVGAMPTAPRPEKKSEPKSAEKTPEVEQDALSEKESENVTEDKHIAEPEKTETRVRSSSRRKKAIE